MEMVIGVTGEEVGFGNQERIVGWEVRVLGG